MCSEGVQHNVFFVKMFFKNVTILRSMEKFVSGANLAGFSQG